MNVSKIQTMSDLRAEMLAIARGERKAPPDADNSSFESAETVTHLLTKENPKLLAAIDKEKPESVA